MNIDRKVLVLASFPAIMLGGCNFNEDFCIREGELVAWCDFSGIKEKPPVPQERHVIPFGTDVPYSEGTTFTQVLARLLTHQKRPSHHTHTSSHCQRFDPRPSTIGQKQVQSHSLDSPRTIYILLYIP